MNYYAQYKQDKWLHKNIFPNKQNGFFIEMGAANGIRFSNTYFFELNFKWNGICIEPNPELYQQLIKNRNCFCYQIGIDEIETQKNFTKIDGYHGLSGITSNYNPKHFNRIKKEEQQGHAKLQTIQIQTKRLQTILNELNQINIDLCCIDTEGSELNILKSIDFNKTKINIFQIENNYQDNTIQKFLSRHNYKLIHTIETDEFYKLDI